MGYVILTTSRNNGETLVMVDRSKQKKSFWSNCLRDAFVYGCKEAALDKARGFKFNNPRVVSCVDAMREMPINPEHDDDDDVYASAELGWDGHKNH